MSKDPAPSGDETTPVSNIHDAPTLVQDGVVLPRSGRPGAVTRSVTGIRAEETIAGLDRPTSSSTPRATPGSHPGRPPETQRFQRIVEIGRGGMATVYRVHDPRLLRDTAMKCLDAGGPVLERKRFVREAQITGQLEHPNVIPVHELGVSDDGGIYLTMKLIRGSTLRDLVLQAGDERLQPTQLANLLQVLMKVCDAVAYAHSRGVVHRDLKPSNIMVGEFGQVYLLDWGIAQIVDPHGADAVQVVEDLVDDDDHIVGTPAYMAPEQAASQHRSIDPRTDVFALGAILYFILTGTGPYSGTNVMAQVCQALTNEVTPPDEVTHLKLPRPLVRIAMRAMSRHPHDRFPNATAFRDDLDRFLHGTWQLPVRHVARGQLLFREGEPGDTAYVIQDGRCAAFTEVDGERRILREMGPGEVFGETAIFARKPRSASVVALTDLVVQEVDRAALEEKLGLDTWMGAFVTALAQRFLELDERLRE